MRGFLLGAFALTFLAEPALTQESAEEDLDVIVVTGEQPGPGLWKVTSGGHVLWILGEVSPYPRKVKWRPGEFDRLLQSSQELIIDFSGYWQLDEYENAAYTRAEKLPLGLTLKDVIAPTLHVRVEATARRFGATGLERLRPFSVTNRLVENAMKKLDLAGFSARFAADELARKRDVKITYFGAPEPPFEVRLKNWQDASNERCLERLVDAIEDGGNGVRRLANAWSVGDIQALRRLVPAYSFSRDGFRAGSCTAAMRGGERQSHADKLFRTKSWVDEAERALRENRSTMAVVLMSEIFSPDGYLAGLRARGHAVVEPE